MSLISSNNELKAKRLAVCEKCPHVRDLKNRGWINYCEICGCGLLIKARLPNAKCPIGKWNEL
jgi:hypothetical protein|tara:strand:- start:105 stop:293 length:189 start_codon:yes stop_codon:yes gene_type:complete